MVLKRTIPQIKRILLTAVLAQFAVFSLAAASGGKILGIVIDAASGEPLPGTNIQIVGTLLGAASDRNGEFLIINIPPGKYEVEASMIGYATVRKTGVQVNSDHTTALDFELGATVMELGETVEVVASRPPVEMDETSTRHFVMAEEISARPATELTQILTTLPGIDRGAGGELLVRRGSLDQVAFLIDGVRARNPLDFQPYTNINLTSIQELEIITGGFNAEYGEAQSGVFNIVTKEGGSRIQGYAELRWTPPGKHHWGTAMYDYSTDRYWENTHARHLEWWVDHPDQWVDPNGLYGNDPGSSWTPEQAYANYMDTHKPLNDYTKQSAYQSEISLGGPLFFKDLFFFASLKYRSAPPITGNSYRDTGTWYDGNAKLTYQLANDKKLMLSTFFSESNSAYGMEYMALETGLENKYAYYDFAGFPEDRIDGQTLKYTHTVATHAFYELQFSRLYRYRSQDVFPNDPLGWEGAGPAYDYLRAVDLLGTPVIGGYKNIFGLNSTGYYYRGKDKNTVYTLTGDMTSQVSNKWEMKGGFDFTYYNLDRFQEAKAYSVIEDNVYNPYEGDLYFQNKLEFKGLIMNLGLRYDFYNPNDKEYRNIFDPFDGIAAEEEGREPNPDTKPTPTYGQLSPRIGISHPISEKTVLHFSYGHFFQRAPFGNYGEGTGGEAEGQEVTGILNDYRVENIPYNLGNRLLKPRKTVAYEIGIEHTVGGLVADVTAYYKDITNNIRTVRVFMPNGDYYLTTGNSDYSDSKGVEIAIRKPLSGYWGGYLNYSWSTGISGRSGDPDVIAAPGSGVQTRLEQAIGDDIIYDPSRVKLGLILATPPDFAPFFGIFSKMQMSLDYQIYFPHKQIVSDNFAEGGDAFIRPADKNADLRFRKEISLLNTNLALFIELHNAFNDKWVNLQMVSGSAPQDKVKFINSGFSDFPDTNPNGSPFADMLKYRNLPRTIIFGVAIGF